MIELIKVSVIIPVYNVEKYLEKNIESLLTQTYANLELIYVDDGSTDNSCNILDIYKKIDSRINVIHNSNHGVSYTRNCGIANSHGDYIVFVDGDDYVDRDYIEYLLEIVEKHNTKMGVLLHHYSNDYCIQEDNVHSYTMSNEKIINDIYMNRIYMAVWNKIYKRDFIEENNIRFCDDIWYAEGMHFNIQCLAKVFKVAVGNKRLYHYIHNPNSAMRKGFNIYNEECALRSLDKQRAILKASGIMTESLEFHYIMVCYMIICGCYLEKYIDNYQRIKEYRKKIVCRREIPWKVQLKLKQKIKWGMIAIFPLYMAHREVRLKKYKRLKHKGRK